MDMLSQCLAYFPILDTLMSYLSATDSAIVLGVTGLLYHADTDAYSRYTWILKDFPEYADWILNMVSKGHTILLVGKDLEEILDSYGHPLTHWKTHSRAEVRHLWLVALATKAYKNALKNNSFAATDEDGNAFEIPRDIESYPDFRLDRGREDGTPFELSLSYILPPPLPWLDRTGEVVLKRSWCTLPKTMDSGISLVYLSCGCIQEILFEKSTEETDPYLSVIFGAVDSSNYPTWVPYIQVTQDKASYERIEVWEEDPIDFPHESVLLSPDLNPDSDMDVFVFAFYRHSVISEDSASIHRYHLMGIEFHGLDPDYEG
ncbi:hypothetical protein NW767_011348 [Fusarium falciforme]|nr:hypothetical protein NW767_011348 [Fusarium falciforme]